MFQGRGGHLHALGEDEGAYEAPRGDPAMQESPFGLAATVGAVTLAGDDKLAGSTSAPVALQVMAAQVEPQAVPALGPLALLVLSLGMAGIGYASRRRGRGAA